MGRRGIVFLSDELRMGPIHRAEFFQFLGQR